MNNYIPFLKFKKNEVTAIKELSIESHAALTPFFDLPRRQNSSGEGLRKQVVDAAKDAVRHLSEIHYFYLDNFDIDSDIKIDGNDSYVFILKQFSELPIVPVIGLDRTLGHSNAIVKSLDDNIISNDLIALRLNAMDYEDFVFSEPDLISVYSQVCSKFKHVDLVLDLRVISGDIEPQASQIAEFIHLFIAAFPCRKIIVAGSSIPAVIADIVPPSSDRILNRSELNVYHQALAKCTDPEKATLWLGDYGGISPDYSEVDMPPEMFRNITAPKLIYSFSDNFFISRGKALKQGGNEQYNEMCADLIGKPYYRGHLFSWGDNFFNEKANYSGSQVTPSTIVKPIVNSHISYMLNTY